MRTTSAPNKSRARLALAAALLSSTAIPAHAGDTIAGGSTEIQQPLPPDIIVIGERLFRDVAPERSLDEAEIQGYGVGTVDELLADIQAELGDDDDQPLIIVDGQRITDPNEIGSLPVEALRNVRVLPRGSAVRAGGKSGQRVVSLSLAKNLRSATLSAASRIATEGDGEARRGEAIYTYIRGKTRANISLRGRGEDSLLESDRDIIQREAAFPYALGGNVVAFPDAAGEIDPLLSETAGRVISVAGIPGVASPTLADFVSAAPNATELGDFRTLRPETRSYELNGTVRTPLAPWLTGSANLRLGHNSSEALRGLPPGLFLLDAENPASPFSRDVRLAYYGPSPLENRSRRRNGEASVTLDAALGEWTADFSAKHSRFTTRTLSERQSTFGAIPIDDSVNPFGTAMEALIGTEINRAASRTRTSRIQSRVNGPVAQLPAGAVQATLEGELIWNRVSAETTFTSTPERRVSRAEQGIRAALDIPLTSRASNVIPQLGNLNATIELGHSHFSDAGGITDHAIGLTWEPVETLRLRASIEEASKPAPIDFLGEPVIITPDARVFDPLTGETVDVVQITGGEALLAPEKVTTKRLTGLLRLVPRLKLNLNAEYTDTSRRDFVSSLPEASAAVMLAFPDRFIRNSSGVLTTVDLRPVNFEEAREKRLRWGFSMGTSLGPTPAPSARQRGAPQRARRRPTTLQLTANHTMVLSEEISIRPGLDPIDLLAGGAIGIGGGRVRHQIDGTAGVTAGGAGLRLGFNWRGRSELQTRFAGATDTVRFSPLFKINLRAFADAQKFVPRAAWAKGLRLSIDVLNLTNDRQEVRNSLGETPLQYQPGYRDPLGRTVEFEIRKVF